MGPFAEPDHAGLSGLSRGAATSARGRRRHARTSRNPAPGASVLRIGREPDNDFVVDLPMVSGHHARIVWDGDPAGPRIEDLGSTNGTAIGSPDRRVTRATFSASDTIYLGSHPIPASVLLDRIGPTAEPVLTFRGRDLVIGRSRR